MNRLAKVVTIAAVATLGVAGAAFASVSLAPDRAPTPTLSAAAEGRDPALVEAAARARVNLAVLLITVEKTVTAPGDGVPPEHLAALAGAIDAAQRLLDDPGASVADLTAAQAAVQDADDAVRLSALAYAGQLRSAEAAAAAAAREAERVAAEQAAQAAAQQQQQAAATQDPKAGHSTPPRTQEPAPTAIQAPTVGPPTDPATAGWDSTAWFTHHLQGVGASGVTISSGWATMCGQADQGPRYVQGCGLAQTPTVIYMKPVDPAIAATDVARGVVIHEYAHTLQYRLGYDAVVVATDAIFGPGRGLEESADCMAIALGATGRPGGYTSDCSGARGQAAAALLAGTLP